MPETMIKADPNKTILNRYNLEDTHWFYRGLRAILKNNFERLLDNGKKQGYGKKLCILDIGCGSGANLLWLSEYGDVSGVDISEFAIDCAKKRRVGNLKIGSAENLPCEDNYFDFAFSIQVFCNIPGSDLKAWKEAYRILKPGGYFVSLLPAYNCLFSHHDVASGSYRRYDVKNILMASNEAGFELSRITFYNFFLFPFTAAFRLISKFLSGGKLIAKTDLRPMPPLINYLLTKVMSFEVLLSSLVSYPCGLSIFSIHRKPVQN